MGAKIQVSRRIRGRGLPENRTLTGVALLTARQLATVLNCPHRTIQLFAKRGTIPAYKHGNDYRFDLNEVKAAMRHQPRKGQSEVAGVES